MFYTLVGAVMLLTAVMTKNELGLALKGLKGKYTDESIHEYCQKSFIPMAIFGIGFFLEKLRGIWPFMRIVEYVIWGGCLIWLIIIMITTLKRIK